MRVSVEEVIRMVKACAGISAASTRVVPGGPLNMPTLLSHMSEMGGAGSGSGSGMFYIRLRPSTAIGCGTKQ
jgi:hypothetical protein